MAILMIYDHDNFHSDKEKEDRGSYKRGYIVQVFEDTQKCQIPPAEPFLLIKVTGAPVDDFETWATESETVEELQEQEDGTFELVEVPVRRRAYTFDLESLPQEAQDALATNRYWEMV